MSRFSRSPTSPAGCIVPVRRPAVRRSAAQRMALIALSCALSAGPAWAADSGGLDAHGFSAAGHVGNPLGYLELAYPSAGWKGAWDVGVLMDYADDPLMERIGEQVIPVIDATLTANVAAGVSILGYARVDAVLPVYALAVDQSGTFSGVGDLRVEGTVPLLTVRDARPGIAIVPAFWVPTGPSEHFLGDAGFGFGATVAVAQEIGVFGWDLNIGGRVGPEEAVRNVQWGRGLMAGLGVHVALGDAGSLGAEAHATPSASFDVDALPVEVLGHARYRLPLGLYADLGGGGGVTSGIGASKYRLVVGLGYSALGVAPAVDNDADGLVGSADQCPDRAEDKDGYRDGDGCPDLDNDGDGFRDAKDECPDAREDIDGVIDSDGCPEDDGDQDAVPDGSDDCPEDAEDVDGDRDDDGCPESDTDADQDGVPDHRDQCPNEPIRPGQNPRTSDGCPRLAEIANDKIVITDRIYFAEGQAVVLAESRPVLDAVARVLAEHPEVRDLLVEGHTDDVGNDDANYRLSEERARAVMNWLVEAGVDRNRLAAKGYGETAPLVPNDSNEHRAQNRRVEFTIVLR